jgi:predicted RNA-binding protein with PUA-like domain
MTREKDAPRRYWLFKTEPTSFSFEDLWNAPKRTASWDGVRNYQARNTLRDDVKPGDMVLIYHSSSDPTGVAGIAEVVGGGYPDPSAFDPKDSHYDPKSDPAAPTWYMVDVRAVKALPRMVTLDELRKAKGLEKMVLLQRGSRLSVQPVRAEEWDIINRLVAR